MDPGSALALPVASLPEDFSGILQGGDGFLELAEVSQSCAEVVQCLGFSVPFTDFPVDLGGATVRGDGIRNRRSSCMAAPRLFSVVASPYLSPISRQIARSPLSGNRFLEPPHLVQVKTEVV